LAVLYTFDICAHQIGETIPVNIAQRGQFAGATALIRIDGAIVPTIRVGDRRGDGACINLKPVTAIEHF